MIYLINNNTDPAINHGIEEYFLRDTNEDVYSLWRNRPVILLGKNQDAYAELNMENAEAEGVGIVRRLSGGGTIYCDLGNMQYTFITKDDKKLSNRESFIVFAKPVVEALQKLGLDAEFTGRNDILLEGNKISGNAQYKCKDRIVHHGTLLYSSDKEMLSKVLYSRPIKFQNKAVKSVTSRVGEIKDYVDMDIEEFMDYITSYIIDYYNIKDIIHLDDLSQEAKDRIKTYSEKFRDDEWNIGSNHSADHHSFSIKYPYGLVEYKIRVKDGKIDSLYIQGDYFENNDIEVLADALIGSEYSTEGLEKALEGLNVNDYIKGMDESTLVNDLISIQE